MAKAPTYLKIGDQVYKAMPFLINTKDQKGRPKLCTLLHEKEVIHLAGGEEFLIAYVSKKMLKELR